MTNIIAATTRKAIGALSNQYLIYKGGGRESYLRQSEHISGLQNQPSKLINACQTKECTALINATWCNKPNPNSVKLGQLIDEPMSCPNLVTHQLTKRL